MRTALFLFVSWVCVAAVLGCARSTEEPAGGESSSAEFEIVARGLQFTAPEEVPAGWVTINFRNESDMVHLVLVQRMPEGYGLVEHQAEIAPVFQSGMNLLNQGEVDNALAKFGELPEWFGQIEFYGGPGLTSARGSCTTTIPLEPGTYLLECYVKTGGIFHSFNPKEGENGMVHQFKVVEPRSDHAAPTPDFEITLSEEQGIQMLGSPIAGENTIAVTFVDQAQYEHFLGHDIHLVRITEDTDFEQLENWMDWRNARGLETPAPFEFLGGVEDMPGGMTSYLHVDLEPGRYAWIGEVPDAREKGFFLEFAIQ